MKDPLLITLRDARAEDAPALAAAERAIAAVPGFLASQPFELTDERFATKIAALSSATNGKFVVAEHDGAIVGHAMLEPLNVWACRHVVHLTLVVHPGRQGHGVGEALLRELIRWASASHEVEKIELHVRAPNRAARELYRKVGFVEVGRWTRRHQVAPGQYIDDVSMELLLHR